MFDKMQNLGYDPKAIRNVKQLRNGTVLLYHKIWKFMKDIIMYYKGKKYLSL